MFKRVTDKLTPNSSRIYLARFAQQAAESIPAGVAVLDAGAGDSPYRPYFSHARYDSTDLCRIDKEYGHLSYICDLQNIPVHSECYNLVFCSQTLEHVPEPRKVLEEFNRVIMPGGRLWLTAPFFFAEHEVPFDFYRYTQYGLYHLLNETGFKVESIDWLEGYFGTLAYQLKVAAKALPLRPKVYGMGLLSWIIIGIVGLLKTLFAVLTTFFTWLDLHTKYVYSGHCKNYAVIAVKSPRKSN